MCSPAHFAPETVPIRGRLREGGHRLACFDWLSSLEFGFRLRGELGSAFGHCKAEGLKDVVRAQGLLRVCLLAADEVSLNERSQEVRPAFQRSFLGYRVQGLGAIARLRPLARPSDDGGVDLSDCGSGLIGEPSKVRSTVPLCQGSLSVRGGERSELLWRRDFCSSLLGLVRGTSSLAASPACLGLSRWRRLLALSRLSRGCCLALAFLDVLLLLAGYFSSECCDGSIDRLGLGLGLQAASTQQLELDGPV